MNVIDVIIILFLITAFLRGIELGVVRQVFSTAGILAGLFLGAFIQGKVVHMVNTPLSKALLALVIIVTCIGLLSSLGEYLGVLIRMRIERAKRMKLLDNADRSLGAGLAGASLIVIVWLGSSIFSSAPFPYIQSQLRSSVIVAQLNKSLPPAPDVVSKLSHYINPNGFPDVFAGLEPRIDTNAPLPSIGDLDPAVQAARASSVKIEGGGCGGISNGSGFVADIGLVVTNAHVVAGVAKPYIIDSNGRHLAKVLAFDPELDIAVLRASDLAGKPLSMDESQAATGTQGAALGYPGGGDFTASPSTILESFEAVGRDIYNQNRTTRKVYSIKSDIRPGNSGGPLINKDAEVIGVIFAESTTYEDVGYALTMDQVIPIIELAKGRTQAVGTGSCAS